MNVTEAIFLFFGGQALVLSIFFFIKKQNDKISRRIYACILLLFFYEIFFSVLFWSRFDMTLYARLSFTYLIPLSLYGPLFYFYLCQITTGRSFRKIDLLHFLPLLLILIQNMRFYVLPIKSKINSLLSGTYKEFIYEFHWDYLSIVLLLLGYGSFILVRFRNKFKDDAELNLWVKLLAGGFFSYTITHTLYCILYYSNLSLINSSLDYFITFVLVLIIGITTYFAHIYPTVFDGIPLTNLVPFVKYKKTGLSPKLSLEMKDKLEKMMRSEKPYLNPNIRLDMIAQMLNISRNQASQIINEHYSINFFDFINKHRIEEAKSMLISNKNNHSITDIIYQCGFNNRISFYKAFKKYVGSTPKEYQKKMALMDS